jgi:hypothetical protein
MHSTMCSTLCLVNTKPRFDLPQQALEMPSLLTTKRRKRVQFEADDFVDSSSSEDSSTCSSPPLHAHRSDVDLITRPVKKRIVEWLPLCRELTASEKQERWIQRHERSEIRQSANAVAAQGRQEDAWLEDNGQLSVARTYTQVYDICQQRWSAGEDEEEHEVHESSPCNQDATETALTVLPDLLSWMAGKNDTRGLEDRMVPWLALERRVARAKAIRAVVQAQGMYQPEVVRTISRVLSHPSRRLGQVLAVADATAAMLEYNNSTTSTMV